MGQKPGEPGAFSGTIINKTEFKAVGCGSLFSA
jgi:hypothetical protein